jgi:hypothetical protein
MWTVFSVVNKGVMVRKGGFEPPRLSAPPPQDGVSASSTTSALCKLLAVSILANSFSQRTSNSTNFLHATRSSDRSKSASRVNRLVYCSLPRVYVARCDLNVIVSGDILQWKRGPCLLTYRDGFEELGKIHFRIPNLLPQRRSCDVAASGGLTASNGLPKC